MITDNQTKGIILNYRIVLLRKAILEYEISVIKGDTDDIILKKLADISNTCKRLKTDVDKMLNKKR